jgi:cell division protein FtsL
LKNIQSLNGGNFNDFDSKYQTLLDSESTLKTENEKLSKANKNFELTVNNGAAAISGLNTKIEELNGIITDKENKINSINTELSSLKEFKLAEQKQEKVKEIAKFSMLSPEIIEKFTAEVDNYTLEDLHSALSTEYVNENANSVFSLNDGGAQPEYKIPTDNKNEELTGAAKLIQKHRNGGK